MPDYRRVYEGRTFFFTVITYERRPFLVNAECREALRESIKEVCLRYPFDIDAWVLMPEHLHAIWMLPEDDLDYSKRWGLIKSGFTKRMKGRLSGALDTNRSRVKHGELSVWQRRFWEHTIRDERDYRAHMDYIHFNPVKHGYVKSPADWEYSTFRRLVRDGLYDVEWGANTEPDLPDIGGE